VLQLNADDHDLMVAAVSHLPHLVAMNLVNAVGQIAEVHPTVWQMAAGGFRDTTRIASGDPTVWRDICAANRQPIKECLRLFRDNLDQVIADLEQGADEQIFAGLTRARELRTVIPEKEKGTFARDF
jgi:prephenate dehydrogenase